jgi:hypothetical protein
MRRQLNDRTDKNYAAVCTPFFSITIRATSNYKAQLDGVFSKMIETKATLRSSEYNIRRKNKIYLTAAK